MRGRGALLSAVILLAFGGCAREVSPPAAPRAERPEPPWISAYYAAWKQRHLPPAGIDFTAMTHLLHFAAVPNPDGTLDTEVNLFRPAHSAEVVSRAREKDVKVLVTIGGQESAPGFRGATRADNLAPFVSAVVDLMTRRSYDGIDIDWEPLTESDAPQFSALVGALRKALERRRPRPLLTAAVKERPDLFAALHGHFDQINLMTYNLAGPWPEWLTWFSAPLFDRGLRFPTTGRPVPSTDRIVRRFLDAGVPPRKLGIGIDFYGNAWRGGKGTSTGGVSAPRQLWSEAPEMERLPYERIVGAWAGAGHYRWDADANAAYISIDRAGSANDRFISIDDPTSIERKADYVRRRGLGGVILWELGGGYFPNRPAGERDPLLQTVGKAMSASPEDGRRGPDASGDES